MAPKTIQVAPADADKTAAALRAAGLRAPLDCDTPEQIAAHGDCFKLTTDQGTCAFVLRRKGSVLWIDGAGAIEGQGFTGPGLELCMEIARQCGCSELAFETSRPGLVRASEAKGFQVAGYIMKAKI